jgi:hypothetical protein
MQFEFGSLDIQFKQLSLKLAGFWIVASVSRKLKGEIFPAMLSIDVLKGEISCFSCPFRRDVLTRSTASRFRPRMIVVPSTKMAA